MSYETATRESHMESIKETARKFFDRGVTDFETLRDTNFRGLQLVDSILPGMSHGASALALTELIMLEIEALQASQLVADESVAA